MSTIEIRKVTKRFGDFTAVRDADLSVAAGEVVCLLGPSGCGKTTTLRMIAGLERATSGDVIIAGQSMNELPPEKRAKLALTLARSEGKMKLSRWKRNGVVPELPLVE